MMVAPSLLLTPSLTHALQNTQRTHHLLYIYFKLHLSSTHSIKAYGTLCVAPCGWQLGPALLRSGWVVLSWSWRRWASPAPGREEPSGPGGCCSSSCTHGWARTAAGLALVSFGRNSWRRICYRSSCKGHRGISKTTEPAVIM